MSSVRLLKPVAVGLVAAVSWLVLLTVLSVTPALAQSGSGDALAWGFNLEGQLGNGTRANVNAPVSVLLPSGTRVTDTAGGSSHSLALTTTGQVLAWGDNFAGQLGNGTFTDSTTPVSVSLPDGTRVTAIAAGEFHSLAITSTGQVYAWGENSSGQLGNGSTTNSNTPVLVSLPDGTRVTAVAGGSTFSLAATSAGQALAWGQNDTGQLGNGMLDDSTTPVFVSLPAGASVSAVAAGDRFGLAMTSAGGALAWGNNTFGQLGDGTNTTSRTPVFVSLPTGTRLSAIAAGVRFGLAMTSTGRALAWGNNTFGQLGNSTNTSTNAPVSVSLLLGTRLSAVAAGGAHGLAVTSTGQALAWGDNTFGALGNGTNDNSNTPVLVSLPAGTQVAALAAGGPFSLAVVAGPSQPTSKTRLSVSRHKPKPGHPVTLTATVTCQPTGTPTGTVTFSEGRTELGTSPVDGKGRATWKVRHLSKGKHIFTAHYNGDSCSASTSHRVKVFVKHGPHPVPTAVPAGLASMPQADHPTPTTEAGTNANRNPPTDPALMAAAVVGALALGVLLYRRRHQS